jgi:hypothetical protein
MTSNRLAILAVAGGFAAGAFGTAAIGDDGEPWPRMSAIDVEQRTERDDERERNADSDRRIDGVRDDAAADVDERDDDERDDPTGGDGSRAVPETHSGGTDDGPNDRSGSAGNQPTGGDSAVAVSAAPAPAPAPTPAPVYDDYSDDGAYYGDGGSDYGDS